MVKIIQNFFPIKKCYISLPKIIENCFYGDFTSDNSLITCSVGIVMFQILVILMFLE